MNFNKKRILLGITGSIAAYKAPLIVRDLIKSGAEVRVVATSAAKNFVSLTVLEELTHYPVISDVFDERIRGKGAWHIEISHWCDAFIIAPCTANTISKLVIGQCDTAITCIATALPANKPFIIAPAMDWTMFEAIATQNNLNTLKNRGVSVIEPASGELASGLIGKGRLPDNEIILTTIYSTINSAKKLSGINVLITAGATREAIDDVRYITNNSSGRMGFALASVAKELGASVTLISGKTEIKAPNVDKFIEVISANDMFTAVKGEYSTQDIIIMAAAVADFTPITRVSGKIKKDFAPISEISVKPTTDILTFLGKSIEHSKTTLIGFALETTNGEENARRKLIEKQCDIIILNFANETDAGFEKNTNTITLITKNSTKIEPNLSKIDCARVIFDAIPIKI